MDENEILDGLKPICLCQGIRKKQFLAHITSGVRSVDELKKITGAGTGSCQGKRCTPRIAHLLETG